MRHVGLAVLIAGILSPGLALACSASEEPTAFDTEAPEATDIVAVQVESLALEPGPDAVTSLSGHTFHGKIRVLKHYRGSGQFTDLHYHNSQCYGLHINVGGIYLIATSEVTSTITLNSQAAPILNLYGFFTYDPDAVLRLSPTIKQLEAALRGDGPFALTTEDTRKDLSIFGPPPPVPPPWALQE